MNNPIKINNWSIIQDDDPFTAPEFRKRRLQGIVTGHPNIDDGEHATTSSIVSNAGKKITTSSGSVYELGAVDPDYEKAFPNASERVWDVV